MHQNLTHWGRDKMAAFFQMKFQMDFLEWNIWILINISPKFVPRGPINNITALVQIMARRRPGNKPLFEPMMVCVLTHICMTRPQWVNELMPWHLWTGNKSLCEPQLTQFSEAYTLPGFSMFILKVPCQLMGSHCLSEKDIQSQNTTSKTLIKEIILQK